MVRSNPNVIKFKGCNFMRQRLVLSVLTGKCISISEIRSTDTEPGLREYEVNLLRLIDKMTNGTLIEVNETGTSFAFTPGSLLGDTVEHECCKLRAIGYYLEVIIALAPFCKKPLSIILRGVTNNQIDPSVDAFKNGCLNVLKQFIVIDPGIEFQIKKRGVEPEGGGEIYFHCPKVKLKAAQLKNVGKVKRIRGTAFSLRVSPAMAVRFIESSKGELLKFLPDVFISTDALKGQAAGKSPGFGGSLVAETTTGCKFTADKVSLPSTTMQVPEDLGKEAAWLLFEEISRGGFVDSAFQSLACLFMAFTTKDVSQCVMGPLSPYTIEFMRHLKTFVGLTFKLEPYVEDSADMEDVPLKLGTNKVLITGVGIGYHKFT
uniref:Putative rna 3'-terminal phosphate cyclase n=1 Tax=Panstrongylus megistus TaxID=65343 RepID=A0A069DTM7_9HEMI